MLGELAGADDDVRSIPAILALCAASAVVQTGFHDCVGPTLVVVALR